MPETTFVPLGDGFTVARQTTDAFLEAAWLGEGGHLYALLYQAQPYVVTLDGPGAYRDNPAYVGSLVGRVANRIRDGRFTIDGQTYDVATNENGNTLHAGPEGFEAQDWKMADCGAGCVAFDHTSPDGHQGWPGTVKARLTSEVSGTTLTLTYTATTDAPTPLSLTQHTYFALPGMTRVDDLTLHIPADTYTAVDADNLPNDYMTPVEGTPFDFRTPRKVGSTFIDHSFNIPGEGLRPHARLSYGDHEVTILSTLPAVQIFTGEALDPPRSGLAAEPQFPPDLVNTADKEDVILRPGETYEHIIQYVITPRKG